MRSHLRNRARAQSMTIVAPAPDDADYSPELVRIASSILYQSPIPSNAGHPIFVLNAAALPDPKEVEFNSLLPYVIARLPGEDELVGGAEYEVILFAGSGGEGSISSKRSRPGWGWLLQAYHLLSRAMRKRIQKLYIVHEKTWVRVITEMFSSIVSPKFRRKIIHASTLTQLAMHFPIEDLLIPQSAYLQDRKLASEIHAPHATGKRAFSARIPFPMGFDGKRRLPRVLRETTSFVLMEKVIQVEGIFRVSAHAKLKDVLKEAYDRGQKFIIWKDHLSCLSPPRYPNALKPREIVDEIDPAETYGPHMATGLIKLWYTELRDPIVPTSAYKEIMRLYGDPEMPSSLEQLVDLVSPRSEWSPLPAMSREILVRHLLPVLSEVSAKQEKNKMTSDNLAICFAPTFVCGPDQIEDIKMSAIMRRVLVELVDQWPQLCLKCGLDSKALWDDLKAPATIDEYEDPLDDTKVPVTAIGPVDIETQQNGIILQDNDIPTPEPIPPTIVPRDITTEHSGPYSNVHAAPEAPQLPPRTLTRDLNPDTGGPALPPRAAPSQTDSASDKSCPPQPRIEISNDTSDISGASIRRKPTPTGLPPRYSTVFGPSETTESQISQTGPFDGFAPHRRGDWSQHDASDAEHSPMLSSLPNNESTDSLFPRPSPLPPSMPPVPGPTSVVKRKPVATSMGLTDDSDDKILHDQNH